MPVLVLRARCSSLSVSRAARLCSRRAFHISIHRPAAARDLRAVADAFLSKFAQGKTFVRSQLLDANQLRLFSLTLDRPYIWPGSDEQSLEDVEPKPGTPLPPYYHYAYFTPAQLPGILGLDGTDASFNPNPPFTRRMWAGGSVHWPGAAPDQSSPHYLRVGDTVTETTTVLSCEPKVIKKTGESMLVVGVVKEFTDSQGHVCVVDKRNWVFREALDPSTPAQLPTKPPLLSAAQLAEQRQGMITHPFTRDVVQMFRFSALTFNGHRIHYDKPWATQVEGHRDVVVHGPLNLITMLDIWRDHTAAQSPGREYVCPRQIEYRATSPVYAAEGYAIHLNQDFAAKKHAHMKVVSDDGTTCMKATIQDWP